MNPYHYIVSFAKGVGGIIRDASLILRPNFNDMANLSLTSPSNGSAVFNGSSDYVQTAQPVSTGAAILYYFGLGKYVKKTNDGVERRLLQVADGVFKVLF
jgi:hypothetical protein